MPALTDIDACVFDAYGTLFDVVAAAKHCQDDLGDQWAPLAQIWRDKQLQYTWLRSLMDEYIPFWQVTQDALDYGLTTLKIDDAALRERLLNIYLQLDAYPEVASMLQKLKGAGLKTAILSNGSPEMLASAVTNAGLNEVLDGVLSVDKLRVFKPDSRVYQMAVDDLGVAKNRICFMSSNAWDACAAANFGFRVVWVNRFAQAEERIPGKQEFEISNLAELPPLFGL
ncbi:MAG: haloacid dehalogenase type II [Rhodospirillales bacterium]|nr:haloacid dehalogenase type II [Rhodospirillales bacterium]